MMRDPAVKIPEVSHGGHRDEESAVSHPVVGRQRHMFIDLYRSAVILLMLEGHFIRTVLKTELQQTPIYQFHDFFHGLSAPAFLFGAGLTFVISTRRRWTLYHHWDPPLARRVQRLLFILLLALVLHLPYLSFRRILIDGTTADYLQLFQCDVLNCIGVGLLLLHTLVFFFKTEARFYGLVLTTTAIVCFLTPLMWDINFLNTLPAAIAQLLNGQHGSHFRFSLTWDSCLPESLSRGNFWSPRSAMRSAPLCAA